MSDLTRRTFIAGLGGLLVAPHLTEVCGAGLHTQGHAALAGDAGLAAWESSRWTDMLVAQPGPLRFTHGVIFDAATGERIAVLNLEDERLLNTDETLELKFEAGGMFTLA